MSSEDEAFLLSVYASTRAPEMALVDWSAPQKEAFIQSQFNAQSRFYAEQYPHALFQIVLLDGRPVGRIYLHHGKDEIRIIDIALLPEYRNQGIGSVLLKEVLQEGREANIPVAIHVERFNPALSLYARLGFHLVEDKGVYYFLKWEPEGREPVEYEQ